LRHILPNTLAPMLVQATYICASAVIVESILSFIGAGTPPTIPSWGNIMAEGRALWQVKPFIVFFPAAFLSVTVLAVNLVGDGLRDALHPPLAKHLSCAARLQGRVLVQWVLIRWHCSKSRACRPISAPMRVSTAPSTVSPSMSVKERRSPSSAHPAAASRSPRCR